MSKLCVGLFLALGLGWVAARGHDASIKDPSEQAEGPLQAALTSSPKVEPASPLIKSRSVFTSALGQVSASDVGSAAPSASGGALMGADMIQMNMKMNMQFMALQNAMHMEARYLAVHQNERCADAAQNFKIAGIGLDLGESSFLTMVLTAGLHRESSSLAGGINVHSLNSFGKLQRFTASFLDDKMFRMTAEWSSEAIRLEDIRKKLEIRLGPDESKIRTNKSMDKTTATAAALAATVWDFTDVVVDRRFELSEDAASKTIMLKVSAPSIPIDVGF